MSVYVVIAQLHRDAVDHCVRPVAAITAVINVPKHWDELTPECCLVAIGLGCCEEGPPVCRGKVGPTGRHSMSAIAVLLRLGNDGSCIVCAAGELIDVRAGAGMGF
jgi:hypothetical protein